MSSEPTPSSRTSEPTDPADRPADHLDVLGNQCSRTILRATQEGPQTAKELTDRTDSSSATVYRRINDLLESDLLEECIRFEAGGSHTTAYRATVEEIDVRFESDGIRISVVRPED